MRDSRGIAGLIGPVLVAVAASEALNIRIFAGMPAAFVYLNGTVLFVAGFAIIRAHNVWTWRWPVAVTLTGWLAAAMGLVRMFVPEAQRMVQIPVALTATFVVFALGSFLMLKANIAADADRGRMGGAQG